jgi:hypothetical protein
VASLNSNCLGNSKVAQSFFFALKVTRALCPFVASFSQAENFPRVGKMTASGVWFGRVSSMAAGLSYRSS